MDRAKIATIFTLIFVLIVLMLSYWMIASSTNDLVLKGGFITLVGYLVKKFADQIDDIVDKLWGIDDKLKQEIKNDKE